jgi:hypothetical protein
MAMKIFRLLTPLLILSQAAVAVHAQESCDSPRVMANLMDRVRTLGATNPEWMVKMNLQIPYFRMKDVEISAVSIRTKGPSRTGLDCEANLRLVPPAEFRSSAPVIVGRFGYVIMQGAGGGFELDMY